MMGQNAILQQTGFISEKIKIFPHEKFVLDKIEAENGVFCGHFSLLPRTQVVRYRDCVGEHCKVSGAWKN